MDMLGKLLVLRVPFTVHDFDPLVAVYRKKSPPGRGLRNQRADNGKRRRLDGASQDNMDDGVPDEPEHHSSDECHDDGVQDSDMNLDDSSTSSSTSSDSSDSCDSSESSDSE